MFCRWPNRIQLLKLALACERRHCHARTSLARAEMSIEQFWFHKYCFIFHTKFVFSIIYQAKQRLRPSRIMRKRYIWKVNGDSLREV